MSQRGLEALLRPKSIAVIGASMKPQRAGYLMMRNLLAGGFNGPVLPVTPAWKAVLGVLAWPTIDSLPDAIKQLTHQFVRVLAGRNVDLDGPPDLFRYLLYEDGQPVEAGIDDLRIETALVRQGDRLQVSHAAGDGQPFAIR